MEISHPSLGWNKACLQCNLNKHAASAANICPEVSSNANKCRIYWTNYRKPYPFEMPILRWCIYLRASFYISMLIWYYINWTLKKSQLRCTHIPFSNRGKRQIVVTLDFHTYKFIREIVLKKSCHLKSIGSSLLILFRKLRFRYIKVWCTPYHTCWLRSQVFCLSVGAECCWLKPNSCFLGGALIWEFWRIGFSHNKQQQWCRSGNCCST